MIRRADACWSSLGKGETSLAGAGFKRLLAATGQLHPLIRWLVSSKTATRRASFPQFNRVSAVLFGRYASQRDALSPARKPAIWLITPAWVTTTTKRAVVTFRYFIENTQAPRSKFHVAFASGPAEVVVILPEILFPVHREDPPHLRNGQAIGSSAADLPQRVQPKDRQPCGLGDLLGGVEGASQRTGVKRFGPGFLTKPGAQGFNLPNSRGA